jgi:hypothetical protein
MMTISTPEQMCVKMTTSHLYVVLFFIITILPSCAIAPAALTGTGAAYAEMRRLNIEERLNRLEQIVCPEGCDSAD